MKYILRLTGLFALAVGLSACGGGGGDSPSASAPVTSTAAPVAVRTYCGYTVGTSTLIGNVTSVADGDTITISTSAGVRNIRLDGIDAPEMAQAYGSQSRAALSALVLNHQVTVAYSKLDRYGRVVGAVFADGCQLVNLSQLQTGSAWFYKAYQCELSPSLRAQYAQAQTAAANARRGLWAENDPMAPWVYRNGTEPATPTCHGDAPVIGDTAQSDDVDSVVEIPSTGPTPTAPVVVGNTPSRTCYVGPRGGTYTLTPSGNKNYSGC